MASYKIKLRPSASAEKPTAAYLQVIHRRVTRQIPSPFKIAPACWADPSRDDAREIKRTLMLDIERLTSIELRMKKHGVLYSADDLIEALHAYKQQFSLFNFISSYISRLKNAGRLRTAETYMATLTSFRKFRHGADIILDEIDPPLLESYQAWLESKGLCANTISFYMRILRANYNRALDLEQFPDRLPFRKINTSNEKTAKRALSLPTLSRLSRLDLRHDKPTEFARDMFLLSFMFRGMSFIDLAMLKKSQLKNGVLTYCRHKTGRRMQIKWTPQMQAILNKYPQNPTERLLPILTRDSTTLRSDYKNMSYKINRNLKNLMPILKLSAPLTLYVARHSWASAARAKGIPLSVISEGMGHDSETTTQIYLASIETSAIDRANALIINSL